ncbi:MAG: alpha-L-rhamnosidase, partial [Acetatifactor sp.]|nr:alpha-L-rhamnosidase [Acetatifactor sp.]
HMGLGHMEASYDAQAGRYRVRWELTGAEHVIISVTIPFGCEAMLKLPLAPEEIYKGSANPIFSNVRDGICHLKAGNYQVQYRLTNSLRQVFSTHTVIRELLQRRDIVEALKEVADLTRVPNQYLGLSIREMASQHGA